MSIEAMKQAYEVPLVEQLESVPKDARLVIDDADGMGTRFIPVGRMCHDAAKSLRQSIAEAEKREAYQEPVAGVVLREGLPTLLRDFDIKPTDKRLYTNSQPAQPKREPLSAEQIAEIIGNDKYLTPSRIARAIEAAHGIKGEA